MCECKWKRARSDEQIEQRVNEILEAAGLVFQNVPYENVTMLMIAQKAKFTRSNIYRYFKSREEIFLALFLADIDTWRQEVSLVFTRQETLESFVDKWTEILYRQKRLLELSSLLALSLEKHSSASVFRNTKLAIIERMNTIIPVLQQAMPTLSFEHFFEFLLFHQALLAGAWPMAQYSETQLQVLDELDIPYAKIDFAPFYKKGILMYLKGVCEEK